MGLPACGLVILERFRSRHKAGRSPRIIGAVDSQWLGERECGQRVDEPQSQRSRMIGILLNNHNKDQEGALIKETETALKSCNPDRCRVVGKRLQ